MNFQIQHEVGIALAVKTKSNCPVAWSFKGRELAALAGILVCGVGEKGLQRGGGINVSQNLKATEPLPYKVSLHAKGQPVCLVSLLH